MPTEEAPTDVNQAQGPAEATADPEAAKPGGEVREPEPASAVVRGSRWVDYDTHELLQMISDLEDERRWGRLREGIWLAILIHLVLLSAVTWIPRYFFKVPRVVDRSAALKEQKDFTYLDTPWEPQVTIKPVPVKPPVIDKQTLDALNRETPPTPAPPEQQPAPKAAAPVSPPPIPPSQQSQVEAPRPAAVPARPNFAMESENPADQLRDAMKGAARNPTMRAPNPPPNMRLPLHPGASSGGVEILSDTQGVDFNSWIQRWYWETLRTWDPLMPDEVNPPIDKSGQVLIRFKVLPSGRLMEGSMTLEGSSGDVALDRAAWGALTGSNYPPLPSDFHGPYLELRALFLYNMEPQR